MSKPPATTADLNVLFVRDEGERIIIGPRMAAGGFRHADLLVELKFVQHWLENRTGVDQVLIDIASEQYIRGRTVAGLVLLKDHLPDGARFAVCGRSPRLQAVLTRMPAGESIPVFESTQAAFAPPPRWPALVLRRFGTGVTSRRTALRIAAGLGAIAALAVLLSLLPARLERDYHRLLSSWERLQTLQAADPRGQDLADFVQTERQSVARIAASYRTIADRTPQQSLLLQAADSLYENLSVAGRDEAAEEEFVRAMLTLADEAEIAERPSRVDQRFSPQRPPRK